MTGFVDQGHIYQTSEFMIKKKIRQISANRLWKLSLMNF